MYQRDQSWEKYTDRFGFKDDLNQGLQRKASPLPGWAGYASIVASSSEQQQEFESKLAPVQLTTDLHNITPESLRATFDWAMGSLLWKLELARPALQDLVSSIRAQVDLSALQQRARAEQAYQNGWYPEALKEFNACITRDPLDFALHFTLGHLYLYHHRPLDLASARKAYLNAARYSAPRAPLYAGRAYLWAAFTAYLQHEDDAGLELVQSALQLVPQLSEAWYTKARLAAAKHQPLLSLPALEKAIQADRSYALRAAGDADFLSISTEITGFLETLRSAAQQRAQGQARALTIDLEHHHLPAADLPVIQRMQAEIAACWQENTLYGFMESNARISRCRIFLEGLNLPGRDAVADEIITRLTQLRQEMGGLTLTPTLQDYFDRQLPSIDSLLESSPTFQQAQEAKRNLQAVERFWRFASAQTQLIGHTGEVNALAFSPNGTLLASAGAWDQSLRLWDVQAGELRTILNGHTDQVNLLTFSPDGEILASSSGHYRGQDFSVRLWNVATGHSRKVIEFHTTPPNAIAFNPAGTLLATAAEDADIGLWKIPDGESFGKLVGHLSGINCLEFTPDGATLVSGGDDQTIRLWNLERETQSGLLLGHNAKVRLVAITPDGQTLFSAGEDQTLRLWNLPEHSLLSIHELPANATLMTLSPDGRLLALALEGDPQLYLWEWHAGGEPQALVGHRATMSALAFSPNGQWIATGSDDCDLRLWDTSDRKACAIRHGHIDRITALAFSPDGFAIASGGRDKLINLWGLLLTQADFDSVADEIKLKAEQEIQERMMKQAEHERLHQQWHKEGRCEMCGAKLTLVDRLSGQKRCKDHR